MEILTDGSLCFNGGVNAAVDPILKSSVSPHGLDRDELAWAVNARFRDGTAKPRERLQYRAVLGGSTTGGFAGCAIYHQTNQRELLYILDNKLYKLDLDITDPVPVSLMDDNQQVGTDGCERGYFCQAEKWMIIQAGDYLTNPWFYDGSTIRQSNGFSGSTKEIPPAGPMAYYMGRVWFAVGRRYGAGDLVGGPSGTSQNDYMDAVLRVSELTNILSNQWFCVPAGQSIITAMRYNFEPNELFGQGYLYIFTMNQVYALQVPLSSDEWTDLTSTSMPRQTVVSPEVGAPSDKCVIPANGDLIFLANDGTMRSIKLAMRMYSEWADTDLLIGLRNRLGAPEGDPSGFVLRNRLYMRWNNNMLVACDLYPTMRPFESVAPVTDGAIEITKGVIVQLVKDEINDRGYVVLNQDGYYVLYELVDDNQPDQYLDIELLQGTKPMPVGWVLETPRYTFDYPLILKRLIGGHLLVDQIRGDVTIVVRWRRDSDTCWHIWTVLDGGRLCVPDDSPGSYYDYFVDLGQPPSVISTGGRYSNIGYSFQLALEIQGHCRIRGIVLKAVPLEQPIYKSHEL